MSFSLWTWWLSLFPDCNDMIDMIANLDKSVLCYQVGNYGRRSGRGIAWTLQWRHNGRDVVLYHRRLECLLNRLFGRRSKKTSKFHVTGLCEGNSPLTGEFPAQKASNTENVSIW